LALDVGVEPGHRLSAVDDELEVMPGSNQTGVHGEVPPHREVAMVVDGGGGLESMRSLVDRPAARSPSGMSFIRQPESKVATRLGRSPARDGGVAARKLPAGLHGADHQMGVGAAGPHPGHTGRDAGMGRVGAEVAGVDGGCFAGGSAARELVVRR